MTKHQSAGRRVHLVAGVEPWFVLDPVLFADTGIDGYRPRIPVHVDVDSPFHTTLDVPASNAHTADSPTAYGGAADPMGSDVPATGSTDPDAVPPRDGEAARDALRQVLGDLGLEPSMVESLTGVAQACVTVTAAAGGAQAAPSVVAQGQALLTSIESVTTLSARLDGILVTAARELTATHGQLLLWDKGASSPDELTRTQTEKWRAHAKRVTRHEIGAAIGWVPSEVSDLVALANTPRTVLDPVLHALATGEANWRLVRRYHRQAGPLDTTDAAALATGLFGDDPARAVTERLDSAGEWTGRPWFHQEFYRALDREVCKIKGRDPDTARRSREHNLATNDVRVNLDEYGTACLMVGCTAAQGAAMTDRIEKAARAARAAGDPRTLRQLRVATAVALLLHGTADLPGLPDDPAMITTEQSGQLTKTLHALPTAELNVIVPLNTLINTTPTGLAPVDAEGNTIPATFARPGNAYRPTLAGGPTGRRPPDARCTCACTCGATTTADSTGRFTEPGPPGSACPDPGATGEERPGPDPDGLLPDAEAPDGEVGVGEVIGKHSLFLAPDEVRTLALTPGSTMYRLLTDPATGVLIERSTTAYRFDTAMRAHIIAADVFCRAPGCLRPATTAQIDHVQEFGTPGGHTCISNGQPLDAPHHDLKTKKHWDAILHSNRDLTWTTLLGRIYTTKTHDYAQYTRLLAAATDEVNEAIAAGGDPAAVVDAAIYQALSYRPRGTSLDTDDDNDNDWHDPLTGWSQVTLTHTTTNGRRTYHPDPETARTEADRYRTTENAQHDHGQQNDRDQNPTPWTHDPDAPPPF